MKSFAVHNVETCNGLVLEYKPLTILAGPHRAAPDVLEAVYRSFLPLEDAATPHVTFDPWRPSSADYFNALCGDRSELAWLMGSKALAGRRRAWARRFGIPLVNSQPDFHLVSRGQMVALGVIGYLFYKPSGLALVAYPETSQHPKHQVKMALLLADALKMGREVMIVTHSHYMLLGLREPVRVGGHQMIVHEFLDAGQVVTHRVSEDGIIDGWLRSFAAVDVGLLRGRWAHKTRGGG